MNLFFAPLQGYTDAAYRTAHQAVCGGVDAYYTPFLRMEHGEVRRKDLRDLGSPEEGVVPQVIVSDVCELRALLAPLMEAGCKEVDVNMGCPFSMQVRKGRGAGLLARTEAVEAVCREMQALEGEVSFSVKMRLGWDDSSEAQALLPILNETPLRHVTLHPRQGVQQYKGQVDMEAFARFAKGCRHPLVYNGDINSVADYINLHSSFPQLYGVMMGRGLLARPTLAAEIREGREASEEEVCRVVLAIHERVLQSYESTLEGGEAQVLQKILPFWDYPAPLFPHRDMKALRKARNLSEYCAVVGRL